jgi:ketosteroid isomerase-like protein
MFMDRMVFTVRIMACCLASALGVYSVGETPARAPESEQTLWNLERAYWRNVQDNDLSGYLAQWHEDFLGWPSFNAAPVHKDHITDWMTSQTSNGKTFHPSEFKPAAMQITGNVGVACYWMTYKWVAKDGTGESRTLRVTHTWIRKGNDWKIIGGMSMLEPATSQK